MLLSTFEGQMSLAAVWLFLEFIGEVREYDDFA